MTTEPTQAAPDGKIGPDRVVQVPVPGGQLTVAVRDVADPDAPTVLLIHGITASHHAWDLVADRLPGVRLVAPDLRGRGRSNEVTGEVGMARHADDMAAVLDALGVARATVVGHSMGGFVAVVLAHRHPERVSRLVLVDGGLPFELPPGVPVEEVIKVVLGPTAARLAMRFASVEDYFDFWRRHPAFLDVAWSDYLAGYFAYDLVGEAPELRPAASYDVAAGDNVDLLTGEVVPAAVAALAQPTCFITVPLGLQAEPPGLYRAERVPELLAALPLTVPHRRLEQFNHYTVIMTPEGADAVAAIIRDHLAA
ncbi:alpha/beta fold hydrolase [Nocardioides sp. DS6]|uniref:Alpha/beta fold hydrolase n=1 Tax=Nocardioides eburneus TaxID=3231482 RepID=A0ABV3SVR7_9ACTN